MKHTKGEWKINPYIGSDGSINKEEPIYWQNVITTKNFQTDIVAKCLSRDKDKLQTNAKLITAAPELLEFAKEMVKRYPNSPWIYEQANKAIKKATK